MSLEIEHAKKRAHTHFRFPDKLPRDLLRIPKWKFLPFKCPPARLTAEEKSRNACFYFRVGTGDARRNLFIFRSTQTVLFYR